MHVVSVSAKADAQSVEPALVFDMSFSIQRGKQVPLGFALTVRSEDRRVLGVARPSATPITNPPDVLPLDAGATDPNPWGWSVQAVLPLTPRLLDHLEEVRAKHRKRDVVLLCEVEAQCLTSRVIIAPLKPVQRASANTEQQVVMYAEPPLGTTFYSQTSNMWVLSGDGKRTFLEREKLFHPQSVTIGASDWVHDYLAAWKGTRYLVIELPQVDVLNGKSDVEEHINAAIVAATKASENVAKGEWNDVLKDLRDVWELIRKDANIEALLRRDGYTSEAIKAFTDSVRSQFELASKFMHRLDKDNKTINPEIRASKEDALVCYSFAMSMLNLVSRKAARLEARERHD